MSRKKTTPIEVDGQEKIEETAVEQTTPVADTKTEPVKKEPVLGAVVKCSKLRVRIKPSKDAKVKFEIDAGTTVTINEEKSTDDFYAVVVDKLGSGYCMKDFVTIKQ